MTRHEVAVPLHASELEQGAARLVRLFGSEYPMRYLQEMKAVEDTWNQVRPSTIPSPVRIEAMLQPNLLDYISLSKRNQILQEIAASNDSRVLSAVLEARIVHSLAANADLAHRDGRMPTALEIASQQFRNAAVEVYADTLLLEGKRNLDGAIQQAVRKEYDTKGHKQHNIAHALVNHWAGKAMHALVTVQNPLVAHAVLHYFSKGVGPVLHNLNDGLYALINSRVNDQAYDCSQMRWVDIEIEKGNAVKAYKKMVEAYHQQKRSTGNAFMVGGREMPFNFDPSKVDILMQAIFFMQEENQVSQQYAPRAYYDLIVAGSREKSK